MVGVHTEVLFVLFLDGFFVGAHLLPGVSRAHPALVVVHFLEVVVAGPEVQVALEAFDLGGVVDVLFAFGGDDTGDDFDLDAVEGLVVEVELLLEVGGDHVLVEADVVPQQTVAGAVVHLRRQVLQVVLYLVAVHKIQRIVHVVEPFRAHLEKLLALLEVLHLASFHEGHTSLVRVGVLVGQLPPDLHHVVLLELAPDDLAVPHRLNDQ